jgi:hypothetical protein
MHLKVTTGRDVPVTGVHVVYSDRGGEFTTTFGGTRSSFDEFLQSLVHRLNTPDTAKSGTTRIERAWRTITKAARSSLIASSLKHKYWWDAMVLAADVHGYFPTDKRSGKIMTCGTSFSSGPRGTLGWVGRRAAMRRRWSSSSA